MSSNDRYNISPCSKNVALQLHECEGVKFFHAKPLLEILLNKRHLAAARQAIGQVFFEIPFTSRLRRYAFQDGLENSLGP